MPRQAIIIGAGPAGITAAYELVTRTDIVPIVLERSGYVGGLARTHEFRGNRIDMGGHRFFSKSDRVLDWWFNILPLQRCAEDAVTLRYQNRSRHVQGALDGPDPDVEDRVMLLRTRKSSILFDRKLFPYPLRLTPAVLRRLGARRMTRIGLSYLWRVAAPVRPVENLEHFLINRFGDELYRTFFESYTEKVWGMPCREISAEWGAQRIKDLSVAKTLAHWLRSRLGLAPRDTPETSTSLVEKFLYPKLGPGQLWEEAARQVCERGGVLLHHRRVVGLTRAGNRISEVRAVDETTGETETYPADYVFSSMPVSELAAAFDAAPPDAVRDVAAGLCYRDFITVGLLVRELRLRDPAARGPLTDSWLYVQEPDVRLGRLQIYNNWSRY
ncbi:MAG TPA: FAD-dependent oxidoreductase, partial [Candidatus Hydrogenedentes bacterium]|nr:FAD-dependent oxidoreductase [Candidatus Hydrogenedentota bacterium]